MKAKGGTWTYDELFRFLKSPGSYIPGTKMSFAGIKSVQDRVNLIAFLRTQSDSPPPIPAPGAAKPAEAAPAAPAADDKSAGHGQAAAPAPKTP
jgi:cytochrome c